MIPRLLARTFGPAQENIQLPTSNVGTRYLLPNLKSSSQILWLRFLKISHSVTPRQDARKERYAGAPPRAPGRGGVTSGATTTCFGGFSGSIFSPVRGETPGGG